MINKTATDINHTMETQSQVTLSVYKDSPIPYALSISYVVTLHFHVHWQAFP